MLCRKEGRTESERELSKRGGRRRGSGRDVADPTTAVTLRPDASRPD